MIRTVLAALMLLGAAACSPPAQNEAAAPPAAVGPAPRDANEATAQDTCGASAHHDAIGTQASALGEQPGARIIRPDTMVTEDFRPDRLNFLVNAEGVVTDVRCY